MHRTLKADSARPPKQNMTAQQERFDTWRPGFNCERPHDALGGVTPTSRYTPSPRPMPRRLPEPEYPGHFEMRYLSKSGNIKWKRQHLALPPFYRGTGRDPPAPNAPGGSWLSLARIRMAVACG